jgi:hypothetical protein
MFPCKMVEYLQIDALLIINLMFINRFKIDPLKILTH